MRVQMQKSMKLYYDYDKQAWIENGQVAKCGHKAPVRGCYACRHHGEHVPEPELPDTECAWFALCTNAATSTLPHPVLGNVPVCERCKALVQRISEESR